MDVLGGAQEVGHRHPRDLDRVLHRQEQAGPGPGVDAHRQHVLAVERDRTAFDLVARMPGDRVRQRRLARAVPPVSFAPFSVAAKKSAPRKSAPERSRPERSILANSAALPAAVAAVAARTTCSRVRSAATTRLEQNATKPLRRANASLRVNSVRARDGRRCVTFGMTAAPVPIPLVENPRKDAEFTLDLQTPYRETLLPRRGNCPEPTRRIRFPSDCIGSALEGSRPERAAGWRMRPCGDRESGRRAAALARGDRRGRAPPLWRDADRHRAAGLTRMPEKRRASSQEALLRSNLASALGGSVWNSALRQFWIFPAGSLTC